MNLANLKNLASLSDYKDYLKSEHEKSHDAFLSGKDARMLVSGRATTIDALLIHLWETNVTPHLSGALLAVGGYGRGELHPYSDVDIAILLAKDPNPEATVALQSFITILWDLGLDIGHSVRTISQCVEAAREDITVMTNLLESRHLTGQAALFTDLQLQIKVQTLWPTQVFYQAKLAEQEARYRKFDDAFQQLEPNVKESPGGLRDIQTITWVANRHFVEAGNPKRGLATLLQHEFLSEDEYTTLFDGETFLWRVRCALHFLTGRHEDRLAFDHQKAIAEMLGYEGETPNEPVEKLMKDYYQTVRELSCLNEMLLRLFDEAILRATQEPTTVPINRRFQLVNNVLDVTKDSIFEHSPHTMLELFLVLQQHPEVNQITARTIRLLLANKHRINDEVRNDLRAQSLFMEIIRQPRRIGHELQRMHRYGVLSAYLPVVSKVEGLMQFDLFHIYTVDEHALFVVRYMRRFSFPESESDEIALVPYVIENLPKLELLYIAGLFHDIAKGRNGDHSQLGADDVAKFCQQHGLSNFDTHLVAWLVRNHLLMSTIAQRKDIYDRDVISAFAQDVGEQIFLDYLYLLTIADMRGTNPRMFNGWKETLLSDLYTATRRHLSSANQSKKDSGELANDMRIEALDRLTQKKISEEAVEKLWTAFDDQYFLRHRIEEIVWHTENILTKYSNNSPLVCVGNVGDRAATAVFVYTIDASNLFARTTAALDRLQLDIQDARISTSADGYTLDTYIVLDSKTAGPISEKRVIDKIIERVTNALSDEEMPLPSLTRDVTRARENFPAPTIVDFEYDESHDYTIMGVHTLDQPGLLCILGEVMRKFNVQLFDARIATIGERAEDYFCIALDEDSQSRRGKRDISATLQDEIRAEIIAAIETR